MAEAEALKVAPLAPPATLTETGTVKDPLLLFRLTVAPPAGAADVRLTLQTVPPGV